MSHKSLVETLGAAPLRMTVVREAAQALELEVKDKGGLSGLAVKAGFALLQGVKPGIVNELVDRLLDDFLRALQPTYEAALDRGLSPGGLIVSEKANVARALLAVADRKAHKASAPVQKAYEKLRPSAEKNVESAAPRLAALLDRHAPRP